MTRSIKKGPFIDDSLAKKVERAKAAGKRDAVTTWRRSSTIIPDFVGMIIGVHDGRKMVSVYITEDMVGHKLGEFAPTRTFKMHSGQRKAGVAE